VYLKVYYIAGVLQRRQMFYQEKVHIPLSQYSIPTSDISNISVTPLFADIGHVLIRELNGSECTYFALDTSGDIQTFDLLYDVDGDSEIFYPITSVDKDHYLVCCGFSVQNEVSSLDDGSSTVLPVPDRLYATINKDDYWHSITSSQAFEYRSFLLTKVTLTIFPTNLKFHIKSLPQRTRMAFCIHTHFFAYTQV